jgi:hypothetical protein
MSYTPTNFSYEQENNYNYSDSNNSSFISGLLYPFIIHFSTTLSVDRQDRRQNVLCMVHVKGLSFFLNFTELTTN